MKKAIFRVDSSLEIGSGHVVRCLTLAEELRKRMVECTFVCREFPGNIHGQIERKGFEVRMLGCNGGTREHAERFANHLKWLKDCWETDAMQTAEFLKARKDVDLLVIDNYSLDCRWERTVRAYVGRVFVIDDLADRDHRCDLLLDQNLRRDNGLEYEKLVGEGCRVLNGPQYALLRPEFKKLRKKLKKRTGEIRKILIFFGGMDLPNLTGRVLEAIKDLANRDLEVDVVVGGTNPHRKIIKEKCRNNDHISYHCQVPYIAELMARADLFIGSAGTSTWERCCVGLPGIVITFAPNQEATARILADKGVIIYLGDQGAVEPSGVREAVRFLLDERERVKKMSAEALKLVDGRGVERVIDCLWSYL